MGLQGWLGCSEEGRGEEHRRPGKQPAQRLPMSRTVPEPGSGGHGGGEGGEAGDTGELPVSGPGSLELDETAHGRGSRNLTAALLRESSWAACGSVDGSGARRSLSPVARDRWPWLPPTLRPLRTRCGPDST